MINLKTLFVPLLNKFQGQWKKDDDSEWIEFQTKQFIIQIEPFIYHENHVIHIEISYSFSHIELAKIANLIMQDDVNNFISIHYGQIETRCFDIDEICQIFEMELQKIISETNDYTINYLIDKYQSYYRERPSMAQILHLSVLVLLKDFVTLFDYYQSMKNGNNIGFVPMITLGMIDNAVNLALIE